MTNNKILNRNIFFLIIFIEGYVVLSTELISFRQLIPWVGTGTEIASIIIGAILLPMAAGYFYGGKFAKRSSNRKQLLNNFISAFFFLIFALSYIIVEIFFYSLRAVGIENKIIQTFLYCIIFLTFPIFLLSQTIPLTIRYFKHSNHSLSTGYVLFFSTVGSFLGAVFTTLILMTLIGVNNTVSLTLLLILIVIFILSKQIWQAPVAFSVLFFFIAVYLNSNYFMSKLGIITNNAYSTIVITEYPEQKSRVMSINNSLSSKYTTDPRYRFPYIAYIEDTFISPLLINEQNLKRILVIGAGGFTLGLNDRKNTYDFIDIDPSLKSISEKHLIKQQLTENKNFIIDSAASFLAHTHNRYDLIIVDVYTNIQSIPMEVTTLEFWKGIKNILKLNGILVANVISRPNFSDKFSIRFDNTFKAIFPNFNRQIINPYNPWDKGVVDNNAIYIYFANTLNEDNTIYYNNKNSWFVDR